MQHEPIPVHIFTAENIKTGLIVFWRVNVALWPVWALLGAMGAIRIAFTALTRRPGNR